MKRGVYRKKDVARELLAEERTVPGKVTFP